MKETLIIMHEFIFYKLLGMKSGLIAIPLIFAASSIFLIFKYNRKKKIKRKHPHVIRIVLIILNIISYYLAYLGYITAKQINHLSSAGGDAKGGGFALLALLWIGIIYVLLPCIFMFYRILIHYKTGNISKKILYIESGLCFFTPIVLPAVILSLFKY